MRDDTPADTPQGDMSIRFVDGIAVLFDRHRQALFTANLNAAVIWQGLWHQLAPREVADALTEEAGIDRAIARRHVAETLRQWRRWHRQAEADAVSTRRGSAEPLILPYSPGDPEFISHYRLLDTSFTVRYGSGVPYEGIERVLGHLQEATPDGRRGGLLEVLSYAAGFAVVEDGYIRHVCGSAEETAALVKACLAESALEDCRDADAIHAAAVRRGTTTLLLPGASGSGKSCLTAGLAAEGFTLFGDDTVVISRDGHAVRPVPFGICIKEAAADLLASRYPGMGALPLHARPDGKRVRYLTPPEIEVAAPNQTASPTQIVFPMFSRHDGTELVPISTAAALPMLMQSYAPLGGDLEACDVDALIDWVDATPCFALRYSSLTDAVRLLSQFDR